MSDKQRLDVLVYENGLAPSREKAQLYIMAGEVLVNGQKIDKPGTKVSVDDQITLKSVPLKYVSRGGLKLEKALDVFEISPKGLTCMDVGASTGGFTDCMLQRGAEKVYSIDVGYNQFDYSLRIDPRTVVLERTNFRLIEFDQVGEKVDLIVTDVSFISLTKLADSFKMFAREDTPFVALIKPQFESEKGKVGKNGVITNKKDHYDIVLNVVTKLDEEGIFLEKLDYSPIKGPKGNIEFIAKFRFDNRVIDSYEDIVGQVVDRAHSELDKNGDLNE